MRQRSEQAAISERRLAARSASPDAHRAIGIVGALAGLIPLVIFALSCSPDLRETVGPRVPFPNVEGDVMLDGAPLANHRVKLVATVTDSTIAKSHTDASGHYGFAGIGVGDWTIKVYREAAGDTTAFDSSSYEFIFSKPDTSLVLPTMDLGLRGTSLVNPHAGETILQPSFFEPLTFEWTPPPEAALVQVRVYDVADSAVWVSGKTNNSTVPWNGLCNRGANTGQPVPAGAYAWRLRIDTGGSSPVEYTTLSRAVIVQEPGP